MKVYEVFKDVWRSGQYTVSTEEGYFTFPTRKEANDFKRRVEK